MVTKRTKKPSQYKRGTSVAKYDKYRAAKAPGWRTSKSGNRYFEARKNRSDDAYEGVLHKSYVSTRKHEAAAAKKRTAKKPVRKTASRKRK